MLGDCLGFTELMIIRQCGVTAVQIFSQWIHSTCDFVLNCLFQE